MPSATDASRAMRRSMAMEPSSAPRLLPDTMIAGRYRILDVLGEGGMGTVYRAEQPALHRRVALKVVRPELSSDASMIARFEREAYASSRITSPHVVVVHDFGRAESGLLYLVMELLEGESLATCLEREGSLPVPEALRICRDVARALEVAHGAGIVHRDLKPDNVFLTTQGDVKVLDFGIARIVEGPGGPTVGNATMTGMIVGTPVYMSPEAISRAPVGPATDLYALGVMLFELLSGQPPFMAAEAVLLMSQHLTAAPPALEALVPSLARKPGIATLVSRLLAKAPEDRGDTKAVSTELAKLAKQYGDTSQHELARPVVASVPVSVPPKAPRSWRGLAIGAVLAGGMMIGGLAYVLGAPPSVATTTLPIEPTTIATPVPTSEPIADPTPVVPPEVDPPPPVRDDVTLTLEGVPEGATLEAADGTLDGTHVRWPRGSGVHTVVVRAEGYEPATLEVDSAEDTTRTVVLERERRRIDRRTGGSGGTGTPPTTTSGASDPGGLRRQF
ncbi:MAG: serine/threonine protein kinase [Deltaproteobacteria bacterium]|nr:serine/threonine protein kinase [Deltaproteobacteria bacterium]